MFPILDKVNNAYSGFRASLRSDWHKYSAVVVATILAIGWVYKDFSHRVRTEELVSKSLLGQAAGLFHSGQKGTVSGPKHISGSLEPVHSETGPSYIAPEATVVVTPRDPTKTLDQVVNVKVKNQFGFTLEPGLDMPLAPLGIGLDFKLLYAYKVGLEVGGIHYFGFAESNSPTVGLSYRLDQFKHLQNTEVKLDYSPLGKIPASLGIRINF